ncbi:GntR family transcriptional regulator [Microlunatus lacustris]
MSTPERAELDDLRLDPSSAIPVAEQIQVQVVDLIGTGVLPAGRRLPAVRALAAALGVAPGTVAKAYRALEQEGFVETAGRNGTVVADQQVEATARTRQQLRAVLQPLLDAGMSPGDVQRLVRSVLEG